MALHFAARLHAFIHGLFRRSDRAEAQDLWQQVDQAYRRYNLNDIEGRRNYAALISLQVLNQLDIPKDTKLEDQIIDHVHEMFDYEPLFAKPEFDWSEIRSVSEWWDIKDAMRRELTFFVNFDFTTETLVDQFTGMLKPFVKEFANKDVATAEPRDLVLPIQLFQNLEQAASVVEAMLLSVLTPDSDAWALFPRLTFQLQSNMEIITSGNPLDPKIRERPPLMPGKSGFETSEDLIEGYLGKTPLVELLAIDDQLVVPEWVRFEHLHLIGGTGHGKSQTLQYLICQDLDHVAAGERSVVVIDSQGDLIKNIAALAEFGPEGALRDRVVIIDPTDVEWPVSLNLFDVGIERLADYDPLERERLTNSILELYDFVLGSLLSAELTQKQNVIFRYVTRLMLVIPDATIHTLRELMEPDADIKFAEHFDKLSGSAKRFFETEFKGPEFKQTKKQVLRRLWGILENQTFERMFSHPRSKLDLFSEMNAGKIILINTAKDLLKDQGSQIFGRFFIALIAQAAQERATLPEGKRLPTFVYVDEAADYFDQNIATILAQARKYKVGMALAHQYLGQLNPKLQDAFAANTSIKLAGGVSSKDARTLAPMLQCQPAMIETQPKGHFAAHVRSVTETGVSVRFPFGYLEDKPVMSTDERSELREIMRERYAVHHSMVNNPEDGTEEDVDPEMDGEADDDMPDPSAPDKKAGDKGNVDITPGPEW